MTTATATKSKSARSIMTAKLTAQGVKTALSKSAADQLERTQLLCEHLENVPQCKEWANAAAVALSALLDKFKE